MSKISFDKFDISNYTHCAVVTDSNIAKLYGIAGNNLFVLPQGEAAKCFSCVEQLCSWLLARNVGKDDVIVAVGGGSIGDTVGFAASIYKRGAKLLHVPTTLIAQIDSSIGGKTAIDLDGVKNAVGTFYHADTLIDTRFLNTLNSSQIASGKGELLKYRMLSEQVDAVYNGEIVTDDVIRACVEYKQSVCDVDFCDGGIRHRLNFGHTVGHAMELEMQLPHGIAVANGVYYETLLALRLGKVSQSYADKWMSEAASQFAIYPLTTQIVNNMLTDKKNANGMVCFALPDKFADVYLTIEQVQQLLGND